MRKITILFNKIGNVKQQCEVNQIQIECFATVRNYQLCQCKTHYIRQNNEHQPTLDSFNHIVEIQFRLFLIKDLTQARMSDTHQVYYKSEQKQNKLKLEFCGSRLTRSLLFQEYSACTNSGIVQMRYLLCASTPTEHMGNTRV